jgi:superfamily II DNA helicase RecQ
MPFKIITIPFNREKGCFLEEELNKFCLNKTVRSYEAKFFQDGGGAYWSVFLEYEEVLEASGVDDFRLNDSQQLLLKRLREWRRKKAEDNGVPVYVICTNKQALELVKKAPKTIEALKSIEGFGKKKIESFGRELTTLIQEFYEVKHD